MKKAIKLIGNASLVASLGRPLLRTAIGRGVIVLSAAFAGLSVHEGDRGDFVTSVQTGEIGVTEWARKAVKGSEKLPDSEIAQAYLSLLYDKWNQIEGFSEAPETIQLGLLDLSYNLGEGVLRFKGVREGLKKRDWHKTMLETLDTVSAEGLSVKGLAVRRAQNYNKAFIPAISKVCQTPDGNINYMKSEEVFFEYKARNGRHPKSTPGCTPVRGM